MAKPLVAIVGRPNVGKSMLFNKLVGRRLSIVEDTPGVTRDRLYAECEWRGRTFDIVDTGGIEPGTTTEILSFMRKQAEIAIANATVIVFLCDVKTGLTAADQDVANLLLRARKPVILAVNKMDQVGMTNPDIYEFYNLGLGDPIAVSAGMRKKAKVSDQIEKFSVLRAAMAIERSDVCLILIDANEGVTEQDTKVAGMAHESGKACIIVVNKWDAVDKDDKTMDRMRQDIRRDLSYMTYAPIVFISALTGQRVPRLFQLIQYVNDQASMRITTGMLNSLLADATARVQPPTDKGRRLKIYYMTQAGIRPPHFVCFCNDAKLFHFSYQRYLENQIRATFGLEGTPIRLTIRQKGDKED